MDLGALFPRTTDILAIWARRRVDPLFREEIMTAVARTNQCRFCTYVHTEWALSAGMPEGDHHPHCHKKEAFSFLNARYLWEVGARTTLEGTTLNVSAVIPIPSVTLE